MAERTVDRSGRPVQQSMTARPQDYVGMNVSRPMLGVILDVKPADNEGNRSSYQREDRRGYLHTCTVLVVQDGRGTYTLLENVIIPPESPSGIDDYYERLPRGCAHLVTGENWNTQLSHINPYDLDGDWCVVSFLGGSLDMPFVLRWWPHPHNPFDAATSGQTNPNAPGSDETLHQERRFFHRINGVELVVTGPGNVYMSTYRANSSLNYGSDLSPIDGRFPRTLNDDEGGAVKVWVKPSQSFELDFNPQEDGMGALDVADDQIPQTNPSTSGSASTTQKSNTYMLVEKDRMQITTSDEIKLKSRKRLLLESQEETKLTVGGDLTVDVTGDGSVTLDGGLSTSVTQDFDLTVTGGTTITAETTLDVEATGPATVTGHSDMTLSSDALLSLSGATVSLGTSSTSAGSPGSISVTPAGVNLGSGALGGAVGGTPFQAAFAAFAAAMATAQGSATVEAAYAAQVTAAVQALVAALAAAVSSTTKVG